MDGRRRVEREDEPEVIKAYQAKGGSLRVVGAAYGMTPQGVADLLRRHGVARNRPGSPRKAG